MSLISSMYGTCWQCTEFERGDRDPDGGTRVMSRFVLVRAMASNGRSSQVIDCWQCPTCGELVPVDTWQNYVRTGDVVVRTPKKGR